jgi:predicted DsbA family dithiol-disulfide isomerase
MMSKTINIEMVSDFVCPWCFVGKRRLKKAIEQRPDLDIALKWRPFQLNLDMPREGRNRRDYYRNKFGDERTKDLRETLKNAGAEAGIVFCDEPDAMAPNTLSAHVLMFWAAKDENIDTDALAEKLFNAHHVACQNIGDNDVLMRIAGEAGMDKAIVVSKLAAGDDEDKVKEQICQSAAGGVSGVPFFIINGKYSISGAQPSDTLASAFDQVSNAQDQQNRP